MTKPNLGKIAFVFAAAAMFAGCCDCDEPLRMVTEATFPPYEYVRGREIVGVDVEIGKAVAKKLGRPFQCETADFTMLVPYLNRGLADIAASGITINEERREKVDFSIPYVKSGLVVVYKKSLPYAKPDDLVGRRLAVQSGSTSEAYVLKHVGHAPQVYSSSREAVAAVAAGRADFAVADLEPTLHDLKTQPALAHSGLIASEEYGVMIKKGGSSKLLDAINEVIAEAKADGRLAKWIEHYTADAIRNSELLSEFATQAN